MFILFSTHLHVDFRHLDDAVIQFNSLIVIKMLCQHLVTLIAVFVHLYTCTLTGVLVLVLL